MGRQPILATEAMGTGPTTHTEKLQPNSLAVALQNLSQAKAITKLSLWPGWAQPYKYVVLLGYVDWAIMYAYIGILAMCT